MPDMDKRPAPRPMAIAGAWRWSGRVACILIGAILASGCVPNTRWRGDATVACSAEPTTECRSAAVEHYEDFDLGFIEFTDRGNLFSRRQLQQVIDHVRAANAKEDIALVVFIHGWKHNAGFDDGNVQSFRRLLGFLASGDITNKRRPIGVYIGWRGLSVDLVGATELTYWGRKVVAEEVGKGGATEVLLRLQKVASRSPTGGNGKPDGNLFVVVGHSFGGAIVLSAMSELMIQSLIETDGCEGESCIGVSGFGHGVVLLNPAIEAMDGFQLKEVAAAMKFTSSTAPMLHVISTDGDRATNIYFPAGQRLGMLSSDQTYLKRDNNGMQVEFSEATLDSTTIGNFKPFRTLRLEQAGDKSWKIARCGGGEKCGLSDVEWNSHLDASEHDPLSFVSTDANFIKDHNDVFNCNVTAYLAAVVEAVRVKKKERPLAGCMSDTGFDLLACFEAYQTRQKDVKDAKYCN